MLSTKIRRRLMVIPVSVTGLALAAGSVAWACTPVGGQTVLTPNSGMRGSTFTATASDMPPGTYDLVWLDSTSKVIGTRVCHHSTTIVGEGVSGLDRVARGTGTVPLTAPDAPDKTPDGLAQVCFGTAHPIDFLTVSVPATFTVAGGPKVG